MWLVRRKKNFLLCSNEQSRESKNFNLAHAWAEPTWLSNNTFPTLWKKEKTCLFFRQSISQIVKRVSCFKSSLLLRIQIKYTHELQFLIKTKESIFNRRLYTTDERRKPRVAWLGFLRQMLSKLKRSLNAYLKHRTVCLEMFLECKHLRFE
jgi:hypothetical protein